MCDCVTLGGKRDFKDVTSLRILRWEDYLDPDGPSVIIRVLIRERGRQEGQSQREREI